jgi:CRISPR-associated endonuclease Cas3-HD
MNQPIAHLGQLLSSHLRGVSEKAIARLPLTLSELGQVAGLLHDVGKYNPQWQKWINAIAIGEVLANHPSHAQAGAFWATEQLGGLGNIIALCVAGHHRGLYNFNQLEGVLNVRLRVLELVAVRGQSGLNLWEKGYGSSYFFMHIAH